MTSTHAQRRAHVHVPARARSRLGRALAGLELGTGAMAVTGGLLLVLAPDGSLLDADPAALAGSPFGDWRWPGVLLTTLVGGGCLLTGIWQWRGSRGAWVLSLAAGTGLVAFEAAELLWLGFQPLELVFAVVGISVATMAVLGLRTDGRAR
ncbi:hypothetical protein GCM10023328_27260 [Modestobacter marinus]|uniref:Integral membrane protein n=1 Tax=Modestobacter marinus TaxID=477641 RepID=A0A846LU28_9ACTN|nr:hypothetical protein [Modestobacter marinus]NIH69842.1 hypothetical protein [Modestobacter marinus]GGL81154.1 hypothetical protein GCM10011589_41820 [Modestobacter marinus]